VNHKKKLSEGEQEGNKIREHGASGIREENNNQGAGL
jgi:hypothetical protein